MILSLAVIKSFYPIRRRYVSTLCRRIRSCTKRSSIFITRSRGRDLCDRAFRGGPASIARWDDFARIDEFLTIVMIHPRGSGLPDLRQDAYLLPDYASDLEALRIHLGLDKPIVMGWSHGGMVAMQFAFTYPDSLSKLILVDTSAYFGEFLSDVEGAVQEFKNEPWFEKSLAALKAEWAGEYQTDDDMARLWAEEMKFYFKQFDARAEAYHGRTKDLPVRVPPLKTFNDKEAATMDLRPQLKNISARDAYHRWPA